MGMYYEEEFRLLFLPRSVDIWYLEQCFNCKAYIDKNFDSYEDIGNCKLKTKPRDDVQKEALRFTVGAQEYSENKYKSQLLVSLVTGKGKTYISIATIAFFEIKSIIITYSIQWLNQWKEKIMEYTGIKEKEILHISGSADINRLFNSKNTSKYKIFLISHSTIQSYASDNGWDSISRLFKHLRIGLKFYDEAHLNFDNMCMIDFFTNTYKTFYLTATPARSSEDENRIYARYYQNIPKIDLFDDDEDPHTKYIAIKYNSHPNPFDIARCKNAYGLDRNKYMEYLTTRPEYFKILTIVMDLALKQDGKTLIYIGTNSAIQYTYNWILMNYPELYDNVGIFTTLVSKEERMINREKRIILSTTKSAGAAVDIDGLKMTIVLNEPFKSHVTAQQSLGRTRAQNTFYIDCVDIGFMPLRRYYTYKRPIFDKYALSCSEIILRDNELDARYNNIRDYRLQMYHQPLVNFSIPLVSFEED